MRSAAPQRARGPGQGALSPVWPCVGGISRSLKEKPRVQPVWASALAGETWDLHHCPPPPQEAPRRSALGDQSFQGGSDEGEAAALP